MIEQIINAMAIKLAGLFPEYAIYTDPVEQGTQEPCFYLHCINIGYKEGINRFLQAMPFEVVYLTQNGQSDIFLTLEILINSMGLLELQNGEQIRGVKMSGQEIDGVGHFMVNYDLSLRIQVVAEDPMETLQVNGGITNG